MSNNTYDTQQLVEELTELLETKQFKKLHDILEETNEIDVAAFMDTLTPAQTAKCFRTLTKDRASEVFANLEPETQQIVIEAITDQEIAGIIEDLFVDDAVDMLEEMPAMVVKRVLKNAKPETRSLINQFLNYPEDSTGSIMTAEFMDLHKDQTVQQAIERIRRIGDEVEQIYTCYVTNNKRILEGVVSLKELLLSRDDTLIEEIMETDIITASTMDDKETSAQTMMKYDFMAMPVVDKENRLVGIITADDVMDVLEEEATEDMELMAAIAPSDHPYLRTSVFELSKNRILWLMFLMISAMVTGSILTHYEAAFVAFPLLVTCMPMLTGTAGNAGAQASTLIIRGMSVGDIQLRDALKVAFKELRVAAICGVALCIVNFARLAVTYPGQLTINLVVTGSLFIIIMIAKFIGSLLPMFAKLIHVDPAIMASPVISTIMDSVSMLLYFNLAKVVLKV